MASLIIQDRHDHVYPPQVRQIAPDMAFHPQIYRADGENVLLPDGDYEVSSWARTGVLAAVAANSNIRGRPEDRDQASTVDRSRPMGMVFRRYAYSQCRLRALRASHGGRGAGNYDPPCSRRWTGHPLRASIVGDDARHISLHMNSRKLSGQPGDIRTLRLSSLRPDPVDVTVAFSIDRNIGDLSIDWPEETRQVKRPICRTTPATSPLRAHITGYPHLLRLLTPDST